MIAASSLNAYNWPLAFTVVGLAFAFAFMYFAFMKYSR